MSAAAVSLTAAVVGGVLIVVVGVAAGGLMMVTPCVMREGLSANSVENDTTTGDVDSNGSEQWSYRSGMMAAATQWQGW